MDDLGVDLGVCVCYIHTYRCSWVLCLGVGLMWGRASIRVGTQKKCLSCLLGPKTPLAPLLFLPLLQVVDHLTTGTFALWLLFGFGQWRGSLRRAPPGGKRRENNSCPTRSSLVPSSVRWPLHEALYLPEAAPSRTPQAPSGRSLAATSPRALHCSMWSRTLGPSSQFECATCSLMGPGLTCTPNTFEYWPNKRVPCN